MPYLNKRNRFVAAAKHYAEANSLDIAAFNKFNLLDIAQSINMKGIYNLTSLIAPVTV
jgi:hypothetical protein